MAAVAIVQPLPELLLQSNVFLSQSVIFLLDAYMVLYLLAWVLVADKLVILFAEFVIFLLEPDILLQLLLSHLSQLLHFIAPLRDLFSELSILSTDLL